MKKILFFLCIFSLWDDSAFAVPAALVDGNIVWKDEFGQPTIPTSVEVNLSTTLVIVINGERKIGFDSYSDFISCQTRAGLLRKFIQIRNLVNNGTDLPVTIIADIRERLGWLRSYFLTLP